MAAASLSPSGGEKKYWWLTNRKMVERYVREAKMLIATQEQGEIAAALGLLEAALAMAPRMEVALEMKARCLLHLRRFKEVADMLQDYIPSLKMPVSDETSSSGSSDGSSTQLSRERVKLLSSAGDSLGEAEPAFRCFSVSDLKKKVMAGLCKNVEKEGQWRYSVLGQACCHLGLMEEAMVLLQTGKRLAAAAFRRESISLPDDIFSFNRLPLSSDPSHPQNPPRTESDSITHLLCHIKLLIRRKTAAAAALDAGLHSEAIRHFSKILDGRRGAPQNFLSECYVHRASAYRSAGRIAEAIADCNKALALDTSSIDALTTRAALFETIRCFPDSLHDLEHLKLLYNSILRDRKLPGPVWRRQSVMYREIPGRLCSLASKIQQLKQRLAAGESSNVDYYALIGLRRGCSRSELERAHLLLMLKHKPDKSSGFMERCEFADEKEIESVKDRARMSALLLYRLIQKGYTSLMAAILEEESAEKQRKKAVAGVVETPVMALPPAAAAGNDKNNEDNKNAKNSNVSGNDKKAPITTPPASVFQGVFCRDLAVVGNLLSQAGFNRPITVKYEALSC
ncbi:Heat shock protein DnaJ with tetratricopeptide repeat [Striga hermonthica]|uniref:Heat shock protein DnaJ with tetratricopeptide repeat n=1 Tax=Striga hermonthica TaxID=68872 RepID=A0A9N7NG83_STRHE|nr:Heat shock protein DnaJ with tetratricopeptide repeat [Striga hermonthica]